MQVFKVYFKILKKQWIPISIYAVIFLAITIMVSSIIKVENEDYEVSKVDVMVINKDGQSSLVDGFLKYLEKYADFVEPQEDEDAIKDALFYRKAAYILTIPEGFNRSFQKDRTITLIKQSVPDSIKGSSIDNAINNYFNMAGVYFDYVPKADYDQLYTLIAQNLEEEAEVNLEEKEVDAVIFSNGFNMNYYNYLAYIIIAIFITGVSLVLYSFHEIDIRRRQTASPLTNRSINLQLVFASLLFVLGYLLLFIIAGYLLNKNRMVNSNTILTWLNATVFAITALSISYLVGITVKSRNAVSAASTLVSLGLSFISGVIVPQDYLGKPVLRVASFTPTYWYVKANNTIYGISSLRWSEISGIIGYMAIQLGFAAAFISIALVVSKRKRQQVF